jgi:hypothetical protein
MIIGKYKYWDVLDSIPNGWKINTSTFLGKYQFITNGISPLYPEHRKALIIRKVQPLKYKQEELIDKPNTPIIKKKSL